MKNEKIDLGLGIGTNTGGGHESGGSIGQTDNGPNGNTGDGPNPAGGTSKKTEDKSKKSIDKYAIEVKEKDAPIVLLFGPTSSGKSMTIVRLARYLRGQGYEAKPVDDFVRTDEYQKRCREFEKCIETDHSLDGTPTDNFLLMKVVKNGRVLCQILEAPGEDFFDVDNPENVSVGDFKPYLSKLIRNLPNRKIWIFIVEAKWGVGAQAGKQIPSSVINAYIKRIGNCKNLLVKRDDNVVIMFNKADKHADMIFRGGDSLDLATAERLMKQEYEGLVSYFKNQNPVSSLWRPYNYHFVPFCTGYYTSSPDPKRMRYEVSEEIYPKLLWSTLEKCFRG